MAKEIVPDDGPPAEWAFAAARKNRIRIHGIQLPESPADTKWLDSVVEADARTIDTEHSNSAVPRRVTR